MPLRLVVAAALAVACHGAAAQAPFTSASTPASAVSPVLSVQQLAPQLVTFAGSQPNFESLVNGLARGTPVQLVSVLPTGLTQTVTFTPAGTMSSTQIAQVLEATRQQLIGLGISSPTAQQLGAALVGGTVPTALGGSPVAGALSPNTAAGAGATAPSPARQLQVQIQPGAVPSAAASTSLLPGNLSDSPIAPGTTSRSLVEGVSVTPPVAPRPLPGAGSSPAAPMRVPATAPRARN
jgi:hypothetical protein